MRFALRHVVLAGLAGLVSAASAAAAQPAAVIPFIHNDKLVMIQVRVNRSRPMWFTVDSGARHSILDPTTARALRLRLGSRGATSGTGKGVVPFRHARPVSISIGSGVAVKVAEPWVIDLSKVPLPRRSAGLLGVEFFEDYVVRIDSMNNRLEVYSPKAFSAPPGASWLSLTERERRLFVPITIGVNETAKTVRARVDTGSGDSVASSLVTTAKDRRSTSLGNGLGHSFTGLSGVYDYVVLGPFRIDRVWAPWSRVPTVGMEIFRRFIATFDLQHQRLYLQPTRALNEPVPAPAV